MSYDGPFPMTIADGGTSKTSVTIAPAATSWAGWDANSNLSANSMIAGYDTTATAASTTTLLVGSKQQQYFTGSTTQTVELPVTSTLVLGQSFTIVNNSSGIVTVESSGGGTIQAMDANTILIVTVILTSGTSPASWNANYSSQSGSDVLTFDADTGSASPSAGVLNILGDHGLNTDGATDTITVAIDNAITLGDLSSIVGSNAITLTTGNLEVTDGSINIPYITLPLPSAAGAININASPAIFSDGSNFVSGVFAGQGLQSGDGGNTLIGCLSGSGFTGSNNTTMGTLALLSATASTANTAIGRSSLASLLTGISNLALGSGSGTTYTSSESNNILLGSSGVAGDQNIMRLGIPVAITSTFIYGIASISVSNAQYVTINTSTNQLGSAPIPGITVWSNIGGSNTAVIGHGYFSTAALTMTMPASPSIGDTISFAANTAGTLVLQAAGSQIIRIGSSVSTAGGTMTNSAIGDSVTLVYDSTNTVWMSIGAPQGAWTPA